ncbi:hypothetical protein JD844_004623, partial [Phrynosoma platyrhinos]
SSLDEDASFSNALVPYQYSAFSSLEKKACLHQLCKEFSPEMGWDVAGYVAEMNLKLFIEHVLESLESVCYRLLTAVILHPSCDFDNVLSLLVWKLCEPLCSWSEERERQMEARVTAVRIIGAIVQYYPYTERLNLWLSTLMAILGEHDGYPSPQPSEEEQLQHLGWRKDIRTSYGKNGQQLMEEEEEEEEEKKERE